MTAGTHGRWMCTINSMGNYVSWSSSDPKGDTDNPDTWNLGCNFVPPINVSTYNITAIGAGGNGANGESRLVKVADSATTSTFRPTTTGLYRILVVGAGGGGGAGTWRKSFCAGNKCGTGGAGASGAYLIADVTLYANQRYDLVAGTGGAYKSGHTGGCSRKYASGDKGGTSSFESYDSDDLKIRVEGGNGGSRITCAGSGMCGDNCGGGSGGAQLTENAISFTMDGVNKKNDGNKVVAIGYGNAGASGGCGLVGYNNSQGTSTPGGTGFNAGPFGITDGELTNIGAGGNGSAPEHSDWATSGANGRVIVYKIERKQGGGGNAARPEEKIFMYSKGVLNISLGRNYLKTDSEVLNSDGTFNAGQYRTLRTTRVDLINNEKITKSVISYPGNDGEQFEGNAPTKGENSYWTEDGGGVSAPAYCTKNGQEPVYEGESDAPKVQICKKVRCTFDPGEYGNEIPSGYCIEGMAGCVSPMVSKDVDVFDFKIATGPYIESYLKKMKQDFFKEFYIDPATGLINYNRIYNGRNLYFRSKDDDLQGFYNYEKSSGGYGPLKNDNERCFRDETYKMSYAKTCVEEQNVTFNKPNAKIIGYRTNYTCTNGGNADVKAYGAGGGGGYAFTIPGFASYGGRGAPGAIIIEW